MSFKGEIKSIFHYKSSQLQKIISDLRVRLNSRLV